MSPCNANKCEIMTKRQFLDYALSYRFWHTVVFEVKQARNKTEFCGEQRFDMVLFDPSKNQSPRVV
jgi:hypothetical protein